MEQKVLIVAFETVPGPTSVGTRVLALTDALARAFTVDVFTLKTENLPHIEKLLGAKVFRVPAEGELHEQIRLFRRALQRQLEGGGYDVVHFLDPFGGATIIEQAAEYGCRTVFDVCRFPSWEVRDRHPTLERDERMLKQLKSEEMTCARMADAILFTSKVTQKYFVEQKIPRIKTHYLPGGVRLRAARPLDGIRGTMKVVYIGDLAPWQGVGMLITAFAKLTARRSAELTIVGPEDERWKTELMETARRLKVASKIRFEGPKMGEELDEIIGTADACVVPLAKSKRAIAGGLLPMKLFEYMAHGRPVVAAATPAIKSVVRHGEHACLFAPGEPQALAHALIQIAEDEELRQAIAQNGRALVEAEYSGQVWRRRIFEFYSSLAGADLSEIPVTGDWHDSVASDRLMVEFKQAVSDSRMKAQGLAPRKLALDDAADTAEVTLPAAKPAEDALDTDRRTLADEPSTKPHIIAPSGQAKAPPRSEDGTVPTIKVHRPARGDDEDTAEGTLKIKRPQMKIRGADDEVVTDPNVKKD